MHQDSYSAPPIEVVVVTRPNQIQMTSEPHSFYQMNMSEDTPQTVSSHHYATQQHHHHLVQHHNSDMTSEEVATEVTVTTAEDTSLVKLVMQDHSYSKPPTVALIASVGPSSMRDRPQQLLSLIKDPGQLQALAAARDVDQKYFENIGREPGFEISQGSAKRKFSDHSSYESPARALNSMASSGLDRWTSSSHSALQSYLQTPTSQSSRSPKKQRQRSTTDDGFSEVNMVLQSSPEFELSKDLKDELDDGEQTDPYAHEELPLEVLIDPNKRKRKMSVKLRDQDSENPKKKKLQNKKKLKKKKMKDKANKKMKVKLGKFSKTPSKSESESPGPAKSAEKKSEKKNEKTLSKALKKKKKKLATQNRNVKNDLKDIDDDLAAIKAASKVRSRQRADRRNRRSGPPNEKDEEVNKEEVDVKDEKPVENSKTTKSEVVESTLPQVSSSRRGRSRAPDTPKGAAKTEVKTEKSEEKPENDKAKTPGARGRKPGTKRTSPADESATEAPPPKGLGRTTRNSLSTVDEAALKVLDATPSRKTSRHKVGSSSHNGEGESVGSRRSTRSTGSSTPVNKKGVSQVSKTPGGKAPRGRSKTRR